MFSDQLTSSELPVAPPPRAVVASLLLIVLVTAGLVLALP